MLSNSENLLSKMLNCNTVRGFDLYSHLGTSHKNQVILTFSFSKMRPSRGRDMDH